MTHNSTINMNMTHGMNHIIIPTYFPKTWSNQSPHVFVYTLDNNLYGFDGNGIHQITPTKHDNHSITKPILIWHKLFDSYS